MPLRRRLDVRHSLLNICFVGFDTCCCRLTLSFIGMGLFPKLPSKRERIDVQILPPGDFISGLMHLPMMAAAEWHGELVADFNPQRPRLRKSQMVGVGRLTTADETGLGRHKSQMRFIPAAFGLG